MRMKPDLAILTLSIIVIVPCLLAVGSYAVVSTTNNGDGTTSLRCTYIIPTANMVDVRDDICRGIGWTAQVTCTAERVSAGQCTNGQLGQQIPNPQTCIQAIDVHLRDHLRSLRKAGEIREVEEAQVIPVRNADKSGDLQ